MDDCAGHRRWRRGLVKREHIDHLRADVSNGAERQALRLWEALIRACEARGWSVESKTVDRETTTTIKVLGEQVRVVVEEVRVPRWRSSRGTSWSMFGFRCP